MKIVTRQQLINYIAECKLDTKDILLFEANKSHTGKVHDLVINKGGNVVLGFEVYDNGISDSEFMYVNNDESYSLKDRNVGQRNSYNDIFWFTDRKEAMDYISPPKPKVFEVGRDYRWGKDKDVFNCVYTTSEQGVFKRNGGSLATVHISHLRSGSFGRI